MILCYFGYRNVIYATLTPLIQVRVLQIQACEAAVE